MVVNRAEYPGRCMFCKGIVNKSQITRHLKKCVREHTQVAGQAMNLVHIAAEGRYLPMYWIHVEIPGDLTLGHLDGFLRKIWLECCGHLSCFTIDKERYSVDPAESILFGWRERDMASEISSVLSAGTKFTHEYDYGSTTELSLRVLGVRTGTVKSPGIVLLARNEPPPWQCCKCGKPATRILAMGWGLNTDALFCDACAEEEGQEEDYGFLPVVNSPRVGVCGYCGEEESPSPWD
jgi:hypothetical protein